MVDQPVKFINSDPTVHNIDITPNVAGNQAMDLSQAPGAPPNQTIFSKPELMIPVRCAMHPWMQAFINVAPSPFYAVSDTTGHFAIKGLPPGTYTVVADQENLGQQTATVTVSAKQTVTQDFTFKGTTPQQ
jgi:Carboxypeptidase regulatory-like domain